MITGPILILHFFQKLHDDIVIFGFVREVAIHTGFNFSLALIDDGVVSRAMLAGVQGTITKEAVKITLTFMAGKVFAIPVLKKSA